MNENLNEISDKEDRCEKVILKLGGTIEEINALIQKSEIPKQYSEIFTKYSEIADVSIEALKRATFLLWFSRLEPFFITGMNLESQITQIKKIISFLDERIHKNKLDDEFIVMLNHYSKWDFLFSDFSEFHHFSSFIEQNKFLEIGNQRINDIENRGEMGRYWKSYKTCS